VMHRSKVALRTWFLAAHLMATHSVTAQVDDGERRPGQHRARQDG
jgi:hypothetical protein